VSICIQNGAGNQSGASLIFARKEELRRQLDTLPSWKQRAEKLNELLEQTIVTLATRNEKLLVLHQDFDALSLDFWREFGRVLGCEDPERTIAAQKERMRSITYLDIIGLITGLSLLFYVFCLSHGNIPLAVVVGVTGLIGVGVMIIDPLVKITRARKVAVVLGGEQEPFWLTGGNGIALSNLGINPPPGAEWCEKSDRQKKFQNDLSGYIHNVTNGLPEDGSCPVEQIEGVPIDPSQVPYHLTRQDVDFIKRVLCRQVTFVFVRHHSARFRIDAQTYRLIWEDGLAIAGNGNGGELTGQGATEILKGLLATNIRYQQLVNSFISLVWLELDRALLLDLRPEVQQGLAEELRAAEQRVMDLHVAQGKGKTEDSPQPAHDASVSDASWSTLIIPQSLRENLQAYCRILRDYRGYQAVGVKLPKGLLLHGPPGCGKTQIARTLSAEAGLNFMSLSTSDCKQMWIGWSADRLAKVFKEAREKQPSLIFIDEIDAVCPIRGAYHDAMSQEFTAQLLQEIDGLLSDSQAIFLVGATNRPDQVDSAILSRFAERIEIPLPDAATRAALLELFLRPLPFCGDRIGVIRRLVLASVGKSGRDLRALVNQAVLSTVKRCSSPQSFSISEADFAPCSSSN
jgi:hypothetical protein